MSYDKAMKHTRNVRKVRKQANNYFGFDTGSGQWPAAAAHPYLGPCINIRRWWPDRADPHTRECIREQIEEARMAKASMPSSAGKAASPAEVTAS